MASRPPLYTLETALICHSQLLFGPRNTADANANAMPNTTMNKLSRLKDDLHLSPLKYKESLSSVTFYGKVNIRRKLRPKSSKFSSFVDFEHDFQAEDSYNGPRFPDELINPDTKSLDQTEEFLDQLLNFFLDDGKLLRKDVYRILALVEEAYRTEPLLINVKLPKEAVINVCGDIHGQFYDLIKVLKLRGRPSSTNLYLFNGDIVDKGPQSLECLIVLFVYKLAYPEYFFINRGNHESSIVNAKHGFMREVGEKYVGDPFLFEFFGEIFRWMPVAHVIEDKILVVHGGISAAPTLTLDDISNVKKPVEAQENDVVAGILWSDPVQKPGTENSSRGIGIFFGPDITKRFLEKNNLQCIVRSHAEIREGCGMSHEGCYTVFSAPNQEKGINGGIVIINGQDLTLEGNVFVQCTKDEAKKLIEKEENKTQNETTKLKKDLNKNEE